MRGDYVRLASIAKSPFWYALFVSKTRTPDTINWTAVYTDPKPHAGNISPANGYTHPFPFGENVQYDKVICLANTNCPAIDEYSVLWIDSTPQLDGRGALARDGNGHVITPYDYVVKQVSTSKFFTNIAISKVKVSG